MPVERTLYHGRYRAVLTKDEETPWGALRTWTIFRRAGYAPDGAGDYTVEVGKMFDGPGGGYGDRARCTMNKLVWAGDLPEGHVSPKSEFYGIHFDTSPKNTREEALVEFAQKADRLIAWREKNAKGGA